MKDDPFFFLTIAVIVVVTCATAYVAYRQVQIYGYSTGRSSCQYVQLCDKEGQ